MSSETDVPLLPGADMKPQVRPGYASCKIGQTLFIVTSQAVTLTPAISTVSGHIPMPPDLDLVLLADQVTIAGWLLAPGRNVTIIARTIGTASDTRPETAAERRRAAIDAAGPDGISGDKGLTDAPLQSDATGTKADGTGNSGNAGKPGVAGTPGVDGGTIRIFCNDTQAGTDLTLHSTGGAGGSGQDGQRGGNGARGRPGEDASWSMGATPGSNGGDGGTGAIGGNAGIGGKGGRLLFHALDPDALLPQADAASVHGGAAGVPGSGGLGGSAGEGGAGGHYTKVNMATGFSTSGQMDAGVSGASHSQERAADGIVQGVPTGTTYVPVNGSVSLTHIAQRLQPYGFIDADFAALDWSRIDLLAYLEMELEQAAYDYLALPVPVDLAIADLSAAGTINTAVARLQWILELAATAQASKITVVSEDGTAGGTGESTASAMLANIVQRADALLRRVQQGQDCFGHDPSWVPTLGLTYYQQELGVDANRPDGALQVYAEAESRYATLCSALESGADATETRRAVKSLASNRLALLAAQIKAFQSQRETLLQKVRDQDGRLPALHTALQAAVGSWQSITKIGNTALSLEKVFECVGQFAFYPEEAGAKLVLKQAAMVIGQSGSAVSSLLSADPQHEYILNQLRVVDEKVGAIDTSFSTLSSGSFQLDSFNGQLLLATRQSFDEFCQTNWSTPARDAKLAMDRWVQAVQDRNASILQYNQTLTALSGALANQEALVRLSALAVDSQAAATNQGLAASAVQASMTLTTARDECLRLLYEASRAFSLATFQPDMTFHETLGLSAPRNITAAAARDAAHNLVAQRRGILDARMPQQHLPSETGDIQTQFGRAGGVSFTITKAPVPDAPNAFQPLSAADTQMLFASLAQGSAMLSLDPSVLSRGPGAPFAGMVNVRLRAIRCWLHGFTPGNPQGVVHVRLTHTGDSTFVVNADGALDSRRHDPITRDFRYSAAMAGPHDDYRAIYDKRLGGVQDGILIDDTHAHALLSPFATWRISLPSVSQDGASTLSAIRLEFFIDYDVA